MKRFKNTVSAPKKSQRSDDLQVLREAGLLEEDGVALSEPKKDDLDILRAAGLLEEKPKSPKIVSILKEDKSDDITKKQLNDIEKYADKIFRAVGIDVEFTRHFLDRVNDTRNKKQITPAELVRLFKQSYKKYGKKISKLGAEAQAVINDMRTDINMPFVLEPKGNELELIAKTVMRKKDFKTSNPKLSFESYSKGDNVTTDDALVLKEESLDDFKHPKIEDRPVKNVEGDWENLAVPSPSPNSSEDTLKELLLSQKLGMSRTEEQEKSVLSHDVSAAHAVEQYMDDNKLSYDKKELDKVKKSGRAVGRFYKNKFQRPRPWELAEKLNINIHYMDFPSGSMDSPSYPSNHSLQSRLVAEYYAKIHPQHRTQLIKAAEESGVGRVRAGWHYNSDHKAGVTLAEQLVKMINIKTKSTEEFTNILENYQDVLEDAKEKEFNYKLETGLKTLEQREINKAASFITEGAPPKEPEKSTEEKLQEQIESLSNLKRDLPNMMATTAGGGSIYLYDLDDVDESTRQDGYFLKYRASDQKYIGEASAVSNETIQDVVGNMVTSNTETGMTVTYEDGDGTLDFVIGTLNQDTTGNAATATTLATARTIGGTSFDGSANIAVALSATTTALANARTIGGTSFDGTANIGVALSDTTTALANARTIGGGSFDGTANINLPGVNTSGNQDTSGTASKATVSDSTANTNFPVVFHDESNGLLDDTGALRYNPSTGELLVPNLTVAGTTTQVDTVTMNAQNAVIFEGATADAHETTLTVTDPTTDRTITLPNATGTVALTSSDITGNAATATALATARTIGGTSFDGTANIAVALSATATALATGRTIGMTGDVVWTSASFDGTGNVTGSATIQANSVDGTMIAVGSDASGDILYYDGTNYIRLGKGDDDQVLTLASGVPSWAAAGGTSDESIQDVVGAMFSSNTETGITATYQDGDGTIDLVVGTLNQDTTGLAATATALATARTIGGTSFDGTANIAVALAATATALASARTIHGVSFDGTANIDLTEVVQDTVGAMFSSNTETGITATYQDGDGTIDLVVGTLNQDTTGTAAIATTVTITDNESTNENNALIFTAGGDVDGGNLGLESDGTLTYNPSTGKITATGFIGALTGDVTGDVTGNVSGTAATVTTAAQSNITSLGTLTTLTVDNIIINGTNIGHTSDTDAIAIASDGKVTFTQEIIATSLDISGDVDVDGTLETDALTIGGTTLAETIADTVGAMVGSNTETGITVTYEDGDNTLDFVIGTLNQNTTGSAATLTTARSIAMSGDVVWSVSFDGSGNVTAAGTIQSGAVETGMIAADAITAAKIADDVINSEHIVADSIDAEHYAAGSVDATALASNAVTTAKINADAVTAAKIADDVINSEHYVDGSIDTAHIADSQITSAKIADGTIVAGDIASNAVTTAKINADAVTGAKIADNAINSEHYTDGSIDTAHIADDQITEAKVANDAIGSAELKTLSTLLIKNSGGTTLKTVHGAGA